MKKIIGLFLALLVLPSFSCAQELDAEQKKQVKELVRETLMQNPEIMIDVINELKKREAAEREKVQASVLQRNHEILFNNKNDPFAGPLNAPLSIVYFGDMNCSFCKRQDPILDEIIRQNPDVKIIYKDMPILRPSSRDAAAIALAAFQQKPSSYLALHKRLMSNKGELSPELIAEAAKKEGFDYTRLKESVNNDIHRQLDQNIQLAQKLGIRGTPALVFDDKVQDGFVEQEQLLALINKKLKFKK